MERKTVLNHNVLVLNRGWYPVNITIVRDAVGLICKGAADMISHMDIPHKVAGSDPVAYKFARMNFREWCEQSLVASDEVMKIRSARQEFIVPYVIVVNYDKIPAYYIKLTRRSLFNRDGGICQYCGTEVSKYSFTVDHVVPRSKGGKSDWKNMVVACRECNNRKDDMTLHESGMRLLKTPIKPGVMNFNLVYREEYVYWKDFIGDLKGEYDE